MARVTPTKARHPILVLLPGKHGPWLSALTRTRQATRQCKAQRGKLATFLGTLGARVKVGVVPVLKGVNGPDDLIGLHGDEAFATVLAESEAFNYARHLPRFYVAEQGTFAVDYNEEGDAQHTWLASKLMVEAYTRDELGCNWGRLLMWDDPEGREHTWAMPMECLGELRGHRGISAAVG